MSWDHEDTELTLSSIMKNSIRSGRFARQCRMAGKQWA